MVSKASLFFLCWVCASVHLFAQQDSIKVKATPSYWNMFLVGGMIGEQKSGTSFSAATVHGYRSRLGHTLGVGVSYEDYGTAGWRTMPVFGSLGIKLSRIGAGDISLQTDVGGMFMWPLNRGNDWVTYKSRGGYIVHPALTYRLRLTEIDVYLKAGIRFQELKYEQRYGGWDWGGSYSEYTRAMHRFSIHFGFGFH